MVDNALSNNNTIQENMTRETKFNVLAQRETDGKIIQK